MKKPLIISLTLIPISSVAIYGVVVTAIVPFDKPAFNKDISFSTKVGAENLIEIFSDGFDYDLQYDNFRNDSIFKDFYMFQNFYTQGIPTHLGKMTTLGGFKDFNIFEVLKRHPGVEHEDAVFYTGEIVNALNKHFSLEKDKFQSNDLLGYYDFSWNHDLFGTNFPQELSSKLQKNNVTVSNWQGARDFLNPIFGLSNSSRDVPIYESFGKSGHVSSSQDKGARIFINDMITHPYRAIDENGDFTYNSSPKKTSAGLKYSFS